MAIEKNGDQMSEALPAAIEEVSLSELVLREERACWCLCTCNVN